MNGKKLLDKMSDVDPKLIADAEKRPKNKRGLFIGLTSGLAAVAAAAVLAVTIGRNPAQKPPVVETSDTPSGTTVSDSGGSSDSASTPATPVIKDPPVIDFSEYKHLPVITDKNYGANGMGGGITEKLSAPREGLEIHSPWNDAAELKTMPVFKSTSTEANIDKMCESVKKAAAALGISESGLEIRNLAGHIESQLESIRKSAEAAGASEEEIQSELDRIKRSMLSNTSVSGKADGVSINLYSNFDMKVEFDTSIKLPEGCKLGRDATDEENRAAAEYLAEKFKELLGYEKPVISKNPERPEYYCVYDGAGETEDRIFNYWTKYVIFYGDPDDPTKMKYMWINSNENCVKLDDYPIYTAAQAEEILKSNKYSDEERMPADAKILAVDLRYTNAAGFTVVLPYYKFYVESTEIDNVCDVYTICAVPEQFIDVQNEDYGARA